MEYASTHERFDAFNINRYNAEIASGLPSCVSSVLMFLVGHINYRDDHAYFPKGTVSGLTAQKIAKALNMGVSTVQGHLSALKRMKIIEGVIIKCQKTGRTLGVRYYFIGFSKWLLSGGFLPKKREDNADQGEPVREAGVGGSDISDPIKRTNNLNIILDDGNLNLEISENVEALDEVIVESNRDANIKAAVVGATVINVESIKTIPLVLGERDLLKVATTLPGIKTAGEGSSGLNVRGGRADQNLFLLESFLRFFLEDLFG